MLKTTIRTTRMKPLALRTERDPRNLTSTENKRIDGCRSCMDASNASWQDKQSGVNLLETLSFPLPPWCPTGPLSMATITLTHELGQSYSRKLPWETHCLGSREGKEISPGKTETNTMTDKSL